MWERHYKTQGSMYMRLYALCMHCGLMLGPDRECKPLHVCVCVCMLCLPLGCAGSPMQSCWFPFLGNQGKRETLVDFFPWFLWNRSPFLRIMFSQRVVYSWITISLLSRLVLVLQEDAIWPVSVPPLAGAGPGDGGEWTELEMPKLLCAPCMRLGALPHDCPPVGGDLPVGSCPPELPDWKGKRLNTHLQSVSLSGVSTRSGGREAESLKQSHVFPSCRPSCSPLWSRRLLLGLPWLRPSVLQQRQCFLS